MIMKPTFLNIVLIIFFKYALFYAYLMYKNRDYYFIEPNIHSTSDLFYYLCMLLALPVMSVMIYSLPLYYAFKVKRFFYFIAIILICTAIESFLYVKLASTQDFMNGLVIGFIELLLIFIFFTNTMRNIYRVKF